MTQKNADMGDGAPPPLGQGPLRPKVIPPPPRAYVPVDTGAEFSRGCLVVALGLGLVFVLLLILSVGAAMFMPLIIGARSAVATSCQNNLRQLGLVMKMYAEENRGRYPSYYPQPGFLMMHPDQVYPDYVSDTMVFWCPTDEPYLDDETGRDLIDDFSYFYLSHGVPDEAAAGEFVQAYQRAGPEDYDSDFAAEDGTPIPRLRDGVARELSVLHGRPIEEAAVPVLVETTEPHRLVYGNVLFLDGHVASIRADTRFPKTQAFSDLLWEIDD